MSENRADINYIARQAWIGFWHSCMRSVGGESVLPVDTEALTGLLNGHDRPLPEPRKESKPRSTASEDVGYQFQFRAGLLDKLDLYMKHIKRLKKADKDSYDLYSKIGAMLLPKGNHWTEWLPDDRLQPWFLHTRPAFGAIAWLFNREDDAYNEGRKKGDRWVSPRMISFRKYIHRPPFAQPCPKGCDIYLVNVSWDFKNSRTKLDDIWLFQYCVAVLADGTLIPLKLRKTSWQTIVHRKDRRGGVSDIARHHWDFPSELREWAKQNHQSVDNFLRHAFILSVNSYELVNYSAVRILAAKNKLTAAFGIDLLRTPYFFKDRELTVTANGRRRPVFHIVRTHPRTLRNGTTYHVPSHFRGEREFDWNGYRITINVPGFHHEVPTEFDIGAVDGEDPRFLKHPERFIDDKVIQDMWNLHVHGTPLSDAIKESKRINGVEGVI